MSSYTVLAESAGNAASGWGLVVLVAIILVFAGGFDSKNK